MSKDIASEMDDSITFHGERFDTAGDIEHQDTKSFHLS